MASVLPWLQSNWPLVAWIVCEVMSFIPGIQSSSIGTLIYNLLKGAAKPPAPLP